MATQDEVGAVLSIRPEEQQHRFRLLELPADVLNLITSENPPLLHLKSLEGPAGRELDSNAVICTSDKTWSLRQVNHSNSVYITQPFDELPDGPDGIPQTGLEAIAKSGFTLELNAVKNASAATYLKAALPVCISTGHYDLSRSLLTKEHHFSNVPLSQEECERGWNELVCFESSDPAGSFRPSASSIINAWEAMSTQAIAEGINITSPISDEALQVLINLDGEWPVDLCRAIFRSMANPNVNDAAQIDADKCARLVGLAHLEHRAKGCIYATAGFKQAWANSLPEKWRSKADLAMLKGSYKLMPEGKYIKFVDEADEDDNAANGAGTGDAKSAVGSKRKWHEKFRAAKKAA